MFNSKLIKFIRPLVSIFALFILFQLVDINSTVEVFQDINYLVLPIIFLLIIVNILLYVFNVFISLRGVSLIQKEKFARIFVDYLYIWSFGLFLPGKIGELGIIPLLKHKYKVPYKFGGVAVIFPKIMMVLVLMACVFLFGATYIALDFNFSLIFLVLLLFIILVILCVCLYRRDFFLRFKIIKELIDNKKKLIFFFKPKQLLLLITIAILRFVAVVFAFYLAFMAFGFYPEFSAIVLAVALSQVIAFIPISTNGLGIREASFAGVMLFFGVPAAMSFGVVVINLVLSYGFAMVLIVYSMFSLSEWETCIF